MLHEEISKFDFDFENRIVKVDFSPQAIKDTSHIPQLLADFEEKLNDLNSNGDVDLVVIGSRMTEPSLNFHSYISESLDVRIISKWEKIVVSVERLKKATFAILQNTVSESLLQLALACDHRVCLPDTSLQFSSIRAGYLPGMALFRLAKYVGLGHAKQMLFTGEIVSAEQARALGLVDEVVDDINRCLDKFRASIEHKHIEAIIMARRLLNESFSSSYEDEIGSYLAAQVRCLENLKNEKKSRT